MVAVTELVSRVEKYVIILSDLQVDPRPHFATNLAVQFLADKEQKCI